MLSKTFLIIPIHCTVKRPCLACLSGRGACTVSARERYEYRRIAEREQPQTSKSSSFHRATQKQSVAYRAPPHKDWVHGKHTQLQPSKGKTDLRTVINSKKAVGKWSWCPRAQASEEFPFEVEQLTPPFTVPVSLRCPQGSGLPTLPPRVPQGVAVSGERISQGPPGNVVAFGMPAPSEDGFRAVSSDASCRFVVSGRPSDCTTRQSVAYRASPPKNGDTGSVLNRSRQSVKWIWGPLLFLSRSELEDLKWNATPHPSLGLWNTGYKARFPCWSEVHILWHLL